MALQIDFQYDLFDIRPTEIDLQNLVIEKIQISCEKVRKGTYSEIGRLKNRCLELEERLKIIERNICK